MIQLRSMHLYWLALVVFLLLILWSSPTLATPQNQSPFDLGPAQNHNVYAIGNQFFVDSSTTGTVAVAGTLLLERTALVSAGGCPNAAKTVSVGGDVYVSDSVIASGFGVVGGTFPATNEMFECGSWSTSPDLAGQLRTTGQALFDLSARLFQLPETGTVERERCKIRVEGTNPDLNVVKLDGSLLDNPDGDSCGLNISAPCGSTVVINVQNGSGIHLQNLSVLLNNGVEPQNVLFNFVNAFNLEFSNLSIPSSVLTPWSAILAQNVESTGTWISYQTSATSSSFNYQPFGVASQVCAARQYDFGDLPESVGKTLLLENGARHEITDLFLGDRVDEDANGQPNDFASGDDNDAGLNDEDGVEARFSTWVAGAGGGMVSVQASGIGCLNAWLDFNRDLMFMPEEKVIVNRLVTTGQQNVTFDVPVGGLEDVVFARYRLSPVDGNGACSADIPFNGYVFGGEVEDYRYDFRGILAVSLRANGAGNSADSSALLLIFAVSLLVVTAFYTIRLKRDN